MSPYMQMLTFGSLMASFAMGYAMENLGWKFYIINASYNILFFAAVFFLWPETKGMTLEEIAIKFDGPQAILFGNTVDDALGSEKSFDDKAKEANPTITPISN